MWHTCRRSAIWDFRLCTASAYTQRRAFFEGRSRADLLSALGCHCARSSIWVLTCGMGPGSWAGGATSPCCACSRWWAACEAAMSAASFCCRRCCSVCTGYQYHASADMTSSFAVQLRLQTWSRHGASAATAPTIHSSAVNCWHEGLRVLLLQTGRSSQGPVPTAKAVSSPMGLCRLCIGVTIGAFSSVRCSSDRSSAVRLRSCGNPAAGCDCSNTRHTACGTAMVSSLPQHCALLRSLALHTDMDAAPVTPLATLNTLACNYIHTWPSAGSEGLCGSRSASDVFSAQKPSFQSCIHT